MKKILCFIYEGCADFEITLVCTDISMSEKFELIPVAYEMNPVNCASGMIYNPKNTVMEILDTSDIEGIIIPGGWIRVLKPELKKLILKLNDEKKLISAICAGPEFLARAGVLKDKNYTTTALPEEFIEKQELDPFPRQNYIDSRVVQDQNVITAKGSAFMEFALKIWEWIGLIEDENEKVEFQRDFSPIWN
ncbi:MAG: thiamine biosynthesis protein ThiJ [archaeon]|nr:thiamine biosynthesis protein ThiJ [archaeon]